MHPLRQGRPRHERLVLVECLRRMRAIAATPRPQHHHALAAAEHLDDLEFGPRWSAAGWFPGPDASLTLTETARVRFLRAVWHLAAEGLLVPVLPFRGNRLERIRLTEAGEKVAAELAAAEEAGLTARIAELQAKIEAAKNGQGTTVNEEGVKDVGIGSGD